MVFHQILRYLERSSQKGILELVGLAGSRLYTSAAYTEEMIDESLKAFDRVFSQIVCIKD